MELFGRSASRSRYHEALIAGDCKGAKIEGKGEFNCLAGE